MSTLTSERAIDAANLLAAIADEFLYACLLLMLGERQGYLQFCRELVARPGQPKDDYAAIVMAARVCAVGVSDVLEPERLVEWATAGVRHCLETARRLIAPARPKQTDEPGLLAAPDWIELNVLLHEAETLLGASTFKSNKSVPETLEYLEPAAN